MLWRRLVRSVCGGLAGLVAGTLVLNGLILGVSYLVYNAPWGFSVALLLCVACGMWLGWRSTPHS
jgi:hypothetical protein